MRTTLVVCVVAIFISGCATTPSIKNTINPQGKTESSLQENYQKLREATPMGTEPEGSLTLQQAASLAVLHNPSLFAFSWEVRVRESLALQAGLYPNPELQTDIENFAGSGAYDFFDQAETTVLYSQPVELGGKRENRQKIAHWETENAKWDYRVARADVLTNVAQRYFDVLAAQQRVQILLDLVQLAEEATSAISERVKAGRVAPIEETRARVELSLEKNQLDQARQELDAAKTQLAANWGSKDVTFESVSGTLDIIPAIPSLESLRSEIKHNPDVQRWNTEMQKRNAMLALEKSLAIPDMTLSGGLRSLNDSDDVAIVATVSLPLTIFNKNQGSIQAAKDSIKKGKDEKQAVEVETVSAVTTIYQLLIASEHAVNRLKTEILPGANSAYEAVREGYQQGKFEYLDVLDAQRTLFESQINYVNSLATLHSRWVALERLLGKPLQDDFHPTPHNQNGGQSS